MSAAREARVGMVPRFAAGLVLLLGIWAGAVAAQPAPPPRQAGASGAPATAVKGQESASRLRVHAFTPANQSASELLELVRPLLSPEGTVKLQPGSNTLEIRDTIAALSRIVPVLHSFDHPARAVEVEVMVVRAFRNAMSPALPSSPEIPKELIANWTKLLDFETFRLMARANLGPEEGEQVTYSIGQGFEVSFRLGTVLVDKRIKLHNFRITRGQTQGRQELVHTNLNLWLGQTFSLGLASDEASPSALMVVVTCRQARAEPAKE